MHKPAARGGPTALDQARANLAGFLDTPLIQAAPQAWSPAQLSHEQQIALARFEAAMRADKLRPLPSCFGGLS
jgi:hypothetical protein